LRKCVSFVLSDVCRAYAFIFQGDLMYANYGEKSDFDYLGSCEGNIVIMRYGKIYRGTKVRDK